MRMLVLVIDVHPEVGQRQFKLGNWDAKARSYDTSEAQDMSAAKLLKFVGEYNDGKLKRFLRSEPVPAEQPGPVIKVVGSTFEETIASGKDVVGSTFEETIASGKDVLVNFGGDYSWCEHCKLFAPEYVIIANALAGTGIVCADMDFPSNDVEDARKRGLQPAGFPELFLFRAGDHTKPIKFEQDKYNGERGMRAIIQFVKDHAALPFQLQGETFGAKPRAEL
ncbi:hypothetical protein T484DRAFT_1767770 [Baffinella frigidus]|nr:hypothetical protein T484DRAFT_1767770 [Cryptophyta sp. CCMP2293]